MEYKIVLYISCDQLSLFFLFLYVCIYYLTVQICLASDSVSSLYHSRHPKEFVFCIHIRIYVLSASIRIWQKSELRYERDITCFLIQSVFKNVSYAPICSYAPMLSFKRKKGTQMYQKNSTKIWMDNCCKVCVLVKFDVQQKPRQGDQKSEIDTWIVAKCSYLLTRIFIAS